MTQFYKENRLTS